MTLDLTIIILTLHQQLENLLDEQEPSGPEQELVTAEIIASSGGVIAPGENNL